MIIATRINMSETREETEFLKRKMLSVHLGEIEGKPFKFTKKMNDCGYGIDIILETITDVVEVVRCRDCKYFEMDDDGFTYCVASTGLDSKMAVDYCSCGERRANDGT